ncbi:unnamed protein product, partial [Bubo scandiacus]
APLREAAAAGPGARGTAAARPVRSRPASPGCGAGGQNVPAPGYRPGASRGSSLSGAGGALRPPLPVSPLLPGTGCASDPPAQRRGPPGGVGGGGDGRETHPAAARGSSAAAPGPT